MQRLRNIFEDEKEFALICGELSHQRIWYKNKIGGENPLSYAISYMTDEESSLLHKYLLKGFELCFFFKY